MSSIPVISLSTNSVSFLPFTRILLLVKYRFIDKALKKKIDATKRQQNVLYEYTKGGLVITADAATFELLQS
jgi:hypothetical protein